MKKAPLTIIILNRNQANHLNQLLPQLSWAQHLIVADDHSTDNSRAVAKKHRATIIHTTTDQGFARARSQALKQATTKWVLFLDTDERVGEKLKQEIITATKNKKNPIKGYFVKRQDFFLGRQLRYGETAHVKLLRLAQKGSGKWIRPIHETWQIHGPTQTLNNSLIHFPHPTISQFLNQINHYTDLEATYCQKEPWSFLVTLTYPIGKFISNYFLKLGFLDGFPGLAMAIMMSLHSFIVRVKQYEKTQT